MENVEKRRVIHLFDQWSNQGHKRGAISDIVSGFLKRIIIFTPNLIACEMQKNIVKLNKPIQIGFKVLEDSKWQMYSFHYDFTKARYGDDAELMYMDTDSYIYNFKHRDFYADLKELVDEGTSLFDTSNYENDNIYGIKSINAQKLGSMKDELAGQILTRFVALRAKCYAYEKMNDGLSIRAKGVQRKSAADITINDYLSCLDDRSLKIYKDQTYFKSDLHIVYTDVVTKVALNGGDNKRCIQSDGVHTLAWGHYAISSIDE